MFSERPAAVLWRAKGSSVALRRHVSNIPSLRAAWNVAAPVVASTADVAIFKMPRLRACASWSSMRVAVLRWRSASFRRPHSSPVTKAMAVPAVVALLLLRFLCGKADLCGRFSYIAPYCSSLCLSRYIAYAGQTAAPIAAQYIAATWCGVARAADA